LDANLVLREPWPEKMKSEIHKIKLPVYFMAKTKKINWMGKGQPKLAAGSLSYHG